MNDSSNVRRQAAGPVGQGNRPQVIASRTSPVVKPSEVARSMYTKSVPLVNAGTVDEGGEPPVKVIDIEPE